MSAAFRIKFGQESFPLPLGESLVGRDATCQIQLDHRSVSRRHARILLVGNTPTIEDLGSRNGTYVDGEQISSPRPLCSGAEVKVGTQTFTVTQEPMEWSQEATQEVASVVPPYQVPEMRTCVGCRHLVAAKNQKCPLCGMDQRHRSNETGMTLEVWKDPKGRRSSRRIPVKLRGLYVSAMLTIECDISDLSLGGAFVRAELLDEPMTPCDLVVFVAKDDVVRLSGQVVRVERQRLAEGMGIQFSTLGSAASTWIDTVIAIIERQS